MLRTLLQVKASGSIWVLCPLGAESLCWSPSRRGQRNPRNHSSNEPLTLTLKVATQNLEDRIKCSHVVSTVCHTMLKHKLTFVLPLVLPLGPSVSKYETTNRKRGNYIKILASSEVATMSFAKQHGGREPERMPALYYWSLCPDKAVTGEASCLYSLYSS